MEDLVLRLAQLSAAQQEANSVQRETNSRLQESSDRQQQALQDANVRHQEAHLETVRLLSAQISALSDAAERDRQAQSQAAERDRQVHAEATAALAAAAEQDRKTSKEVLQQLSQRSQEHLSSGITPGIVQASHFLQKMTPHDDVEAFLHTFERTALREDWPKTQWAGLVAPFLTGESQKVYFDLTPESAHDYDKLKKEILCRLGFTVAVRAQRVHQYQTDTSPRSQMHDLCHLVRKWLQPETLIAPQIVEHVTMDRFLTALPHTLRKWVSHADPQTADQMVEMIERYLAAEGYLAGDSQKVKGRRRGCPGQQTGTHMAAVKVGGKVVQALLVTLIDAKLMDTNQILEQQVTVQFIHGDVKTYSTAIVEFETQMIGKLLLVLATVAAIKAEEVCYGTLGCFTDGPPYSIGRPFAPLPWPPEKIGTQFFLFTRRSQRRFEIVTSQNVSSSTFSSNLRSIFIIHGFLSNGLDGWIVNMCKTLLRASNVNCISVGWGKGARALYTQAANNVRVVGAQVYLFINSLQEAFEYPLSQVYLIGHSLGAQVAGEAGKRQPGIGRITGLDPAGPYFIDSPPEVHLNPDDAVFVDVIHTNGFTWDNWGCGMFKPVGHLDFYPNGGKLMPGCDPSTLWGFGLNDIFDGLQGTVCSHERSHQMFQKSIMWPDGFVSYPGPSYRGFKKGAGFPCHAGSCVTMGYHADSYADFYTDEDPKNRQTFYLVTGDESNFLRWRYNVHIGISATEEVEGSISVSLCGKDGCSSQNEIDNGLISPNSTYSVFIDLDLNIKPVKKVVFVWQKEVDTDTDPRVGASFVKVIYGPDAAKYIFCGGNMADANIGQTLTAC
ncbi:pancreatic lipase-related protein 2-like [Hyperolius riggenbachi]|uniref:pancreatic lipase-related protein 2-like n=1 Tax=Hyperolius riggenbachi TaxID=752182 RepID=UPI0035A3631A